MNMARTLGAAAACAAVLSVGGAAAASASALPKVQPAPGGWSHMTTRPGEINVGNGGAPFVRHLSWRTWASGTATTRTGQLVRQSDPNCMPSYECPVSKKPVTVYLHDVKSHNGTAYFAKMRWSYTSRNGHRETAYWRFSNEGGTVPAWH